MPPKGFTVVSIHSDIYDDFRKCLYYDEYRDYSASSVIETLMIKYIKNYKGPKSKGKRSIRATRGKK